MAELQTKAETGSAPASASASVAATTSSVDERAVVPPPETTAAEESKALVVVERTPVPAENLTSRGSLDRDIALAELVKERRLSYVKAWEESEKTKAGNRAEKKLSAVVAWENKKKAILEAKLKKIEEQLERKKAEHLERMKNKMALVHKEAEEKRALIEAKRGEEVLKTQEIAAKHRATGTTPKKSLGCI